MMNLIRIAAQIDNVKNRFEADPDFVNLCQTKLDEIQGIEPIKIRSAVIIEDDLVLSVNGGGISTSWEIYFDNYLSMEEFLREFETTVKDTLLAYEEGPI